MMIIIFEYYRTKTARYSSFFTRSVSNCRLSDVVVLLSFSIPEGKEGIKPRFDNGSASTLNSGI